MHNLRNNHRMTLLILAAMVVGSLTLPTTVVAQTSSVSKTAHKPATGGGPAKMATGTGKKSSRSGRKSSSRTKRVKGQAAPTADRINEIQSALARKGEYTGTPSGKWDDSTVEAMKKFQASHGLSTLMRFGRSTVPRSFVRAGRLRRSAAGRRRRRLFRMVAG